MTEKGDNPTLVLRPEADVPPPTFSRHYRRPPFGTRAVELPTGFQSNEADTQGLKFMRRIVSVGLLLAIGFAMGRVYGTIDIYRQSGTGEYINIPFEHLSNMFESGTVYVSYPSDWSIHATRRLNPTVTLHGNWSGAYIQITCNATDQKHSSGIITSRYNPSSGDIELLDDERKLLIHITKRDEYNLHLDAVAVSALIKFMAETSFPRKVTVAGQSPPRTGLNPLYRIPTIGIQNPAGSMSGKGFNKDSIPQPPSDPFKVMRRYCG
ncbi:hypothetical protein [Methylobacterium sp. CM6244]